MKIQYFIVALVLVSSCYPSMKDLTKYDLSSEEKKEWNSFKSKGLNLSLAHPDEIVAKDSEDIKDAIYLYNDKHKNGTLRFSMLIKPFDLEGRLDEVGDEMAIGATRKFNYSNVRNGVINYGRKKAYVHEFSTATFLGESTNHHHMILPIDGERFLITLSSQTAHYNSARKKMHKILRSLRIE